jgi:hypothetical protein
MPIYRPIEGEIVEQTKFISRQAIARTRLEFAEQGEGSGDYRKFDPVDFGKPLSIVLRRIYTGRHPEKHLFSDRKPMLLSSAVKDITTTAAAARALNILKKSVGRNSTFSGPDASEEGTELIYYTPAMASPLITVSLTLMFEDFDQELFDRASKLFGDLARVPIFMPATGYLLGASTVLKLAGNVGSQLVNGHPVLEENMQFDFSFGGGSIPKPGFWILSSGILDVNQFVFDPDKGLIEKSNSTSYAGPDPVLIVTVDGKAINGLANFTPLLASASLLGRFFNQKDGSEVAMDTVLEAVRLYNDLSYRRKAEDTKTKLASLPANSPDRKKLEEEVQAFNNNIMEKRLQL